MKRFSNRLALPSQSRLLTIHSVLYQLAVSLAGGFVGAFLLRNGFSLTEALSIFALLLAMRLGMRLLTLALVRELGFKKALILGVVLNACQFGPLTQAQHSGWLLVWIITVSVAESLYWPIYHSASAVVGHNAFGRELGIRSAAGSMVGVVGPAVGGLVLACYGAITGFALAAFMAVLSIAPMIGLKRILAGPVPALRSTLRRPHYRGMVVFAADGWMSSGTTIAWPMIMFLSLGSSYEALGITNAIAGTAGALAGLYSGIIIDRGGRQRSVTWVSISLAFAIALRASAYWSPTAATMANAVGAAVMGFYVPILMSVMYAGAKKSEGAYAYHFAAEAGWDLGAAAGCLAAAMVASAGALPSLAALPCILALLILFRELRRPAPDVPRII